jgi:hypothetical protein
MHKRLSSHTVVWSLWLPLHRLVTTSCSSNKCGGRFDPPAPSAPSRRHLHSSNKHGPRLDPPTPSRSSNECRGCYLSITLPLFKQAWRSSGPRYCSHPLFKQAGRCSWDPPALTIVLYLICRSLTNIQQFNTINLISFVY